MKNNTSRILLGLAVAGLSGGVVAGVLSPEGVSAKSDKVSVITNIRDDNNPAGGTSSTPVDTGVDTTVVDSGADPAASSLNSGVTNVAPKDVVPGATEEDNGLSGIDPTSPGTGIFGGADEAMMAASGVGFAVLVGSIVLLSGGITFAVEERRR